MLETLSSNPLFFFLVIIIFIVLFFLVAAINWWKYIAVAIPYFGLAFGLLVYGNGMNFNTIVWVEVVTLIMWLMFLFGPFRVSAWVVINEKPAENPKKIFMSLMALDILIAGSIYGYLIMQYPDFFNGLGWYLLIVFGFILLLAGYWVLYGFYSIILTYFSLGRQDYQCRVIGCRIHKMRGRGDGYRRIVSFDRDSNEYSVTPSVYKEMTRNIGATYTYTLITSFNGRQFIKKRPVQVEQASAEGAYGDMNLWKKNKTTNTSSTTNTTNTVWQQGDPFDGSAFGSTAKTPEELINELLGQAAGGNRKESTITSNGQTLRVIINGDKGILLYRRFEGDPGFSSKNPNYTGYETDITEFILNGGQHEKYPTSWVLPSEEVERGLAFFQKEKKLPDFITWQNIT